MCKVKPISSGTVFGRLKIVDGIHRMSEGKTPRALFKVECECGFVFEVIGTSLRKGVATSCKDCSFKYRELNRANHVNQISQLYHHNIVIRCRDANKFIANNLTIEEFSALAIKDCHYCGEPPKPSMMFKGRKYVNTDEIKVNGIDRLDSDKGYILDNCVPCCSTCNKMKMDLHVDDFKDIIRKITINLNLL